MFKITLQGFSDDKNIQSCLAFSTRHFIPTPKICLYETLNNEREFVAKTFCKLDDREDICSPVLVYVVMAVGVTVNETRSES